MGDLSERLGQRRDRLTDLRDFAFGNSAELLHVAHHQIADLRRLQLHQSAAGRIDGE